MSLQQPHNPRRSVKTLQIGEHTFQIHKLNAVNQFKLMCKVSGVLGGMFENMKPVDTAEGVVMTPDIGKGMQLLSELPDEVIEMLYNITLGCVKYKAVDERYYPLLQGQQLAIGADDDSFLFPLILNVVAINLENFMKGVDLLSKTQETAP